MFKISDPKTLVRNYLQPLAQGGWVDLQRGLGFDSCRGSTLNREIDEFAPSPYDLYGTIMLKM